MRPERTVRAFTLTDLLVAVAAVGLALAACVPALSGVRGASSTSVSEGNLALLGAAHAVYAADWNGRQITFIVDDISTYGSNYQQAFSAYHDAQGGCSSGGAGCHPAVLLGWGCNDTGSCGHWGFYNHNPGNWIVPQPLSFSGLAFGFGAFRLANAKQFHEYVSGRFYDPVFYPPNDAQAFGVVEPAFDQPGAFLPDLPEVPSNVPAWASYCLSPAAMFHPDVFRHPDAGGWQDPWSVDHAFTAPNLTEAQYPDLKTLMLEHHWNQNPPIGGVCNPNFLPGSYGDCEPYYFNHAFASAPVTLFYDLSVRLLPNTEVVAADEMIEAQTGSGLWSRDTPMGSDGYFSAYGYDSIEVSHHILTTEGIRGRDTVAKTAARAPAAGPRNAPWSGSGPPRAVTPGSAGSRYTPGP